MSDATKPDVLPCPFCGGKKISVRGGSAYDRWCATCYEFGASSGEVRHALSVSHPTPDIAATAKAIAAWNEREIEYE